MNDAGERVIVVGMDFEYCSDRALLEALKLTRTAGSDMLHALYVLDPAVVPDEPERPAFASEEVELERAPSLLRWRVEHLARENGLPVPKNLHTHARIGKVAPTLLQFATDYAADVLLVGTHGRKGIDRLLLGSVAEQVVRGARCPVLVVRRKDYEGCTKTPRPDAPYAPGQAPHYALPHDVNVQRSTQLDSWEPAGGSPTGVRIV